MPLGGDLNDPRTCDCNDPTEPYARFRKQLQYKVKYTEAMENPTSSDFKAVKAEVEKKVLLL